MSGKRLNDADIRLIVRELERWREGLLGSKLTWTALEQSSGFSRQALQAHTQIKGAYTAAKDALKGGLVRSRENQTEEITLLRAEVKSLEAIITEYQDRELEWQKRWQRIAYHLRAKGLNVSEIDRVASGTAVPSKRETAEILRPFDKPLPPSGRT